MPADIIDRIVEQNLGVYRAAPSRLQEDVSQEAQVASDYRGRLVYELLQNADDAMANWSAGEARVSFLVNDAELWIANSGRPLTEEDVQGLCGLGASSKVDAQGTRRASIGHKGLGFKSVLEITSAPAIYSRTYSFELSRTHARQHVDPLWTQRRVELPRVVPAMRFPSRLVKAPTQWLAYQGDGFNTAFQFPFSPELRLDKRLSLAKLLLELPLTTVLFLKHLEWVDVLVHQGGRQEYHSWRIHRERLHSGEWEPAHGLAQSGLYRVRVDASGSGAATFLVAHNADVEIGTHRVGLSGPAWEGVGFAEVSVATLMPGPDASLPDEWRRFHVFLPTAEYCPYPLLVNGAFTTDLSRQQIKVSADEGDYNAHLIRQAARLVRQWLLPVLRETGPEAVLKALDRGRASAEHARPAAELLHESLVEELANEPILPTELGTVVTLAEAVLPSSILGEQGEDFRAVLVADPVWQGRVFPVKRFCAGRWARIAADHGATELSPVETMTALASLQDPRRSRLVEDESGGFELDPLLELCRWLWERANPDQRHALESRARFEQLFPVHRGEDGIAERVALEDEAAFYPPRSARHDLPLRNLRFMCHSLCWGALLPKERTIALDERMKAWTALFDINEFRFEQVMQAAVLPALVLNPGTAASQLLLSLHDVGALAAICQLAGSFAKPDRPLRYQRLQSDRALFNLSRLPVPCRGPDGTERWLPAYRVYFGSDWIGDDSVECLAKAVPAEDPAANFLDFAYLAPPERFLSEPLDLGSSASSADGEEHDEVGLEEDTDQPIETTERDRWIAFLAWVGVNRALRPVHFHDVEDDSTGWLTTKGFARPEGHAFRGLGPIWDSYRDYLQRWLDARPDVGSVVPYLYEVHDLDRAQPLVEAAERDGSSEVGGSLFAHLARHWKWYVGFADAQVALIGSDKWPNSRMRPQRAYPEELHNAGDNLWLFRLRKRGFCPTTHGSRRPELTWQRSAEVERRFGRGGRSSGDFLPIIDVNDDLPAHSLRALSERLGIRSDLSPSSFGIGDARLICRQLERLFGGHGGTRIDATQLRTVIKPIYRQVFELLSGYSALAEASGTLSDVPLLAETAEGLRFLPAANVLYAATPGLRERSGVAGSVPTFVLEAESGATAPLTRVFGVRVLESALEWHPDPGESPLDPDDLSDFRRELCDLVPALLARIRVERTNDDDKRVLLEFAERIEPVDALRLTCTLDGISIDRVRDRSYFVKPRVRNEPLQAFVEWHGPAWPPNGADAQALAMALADALGVNLVETFLAFIQSDKVQRKRLLDIAGASSFLADAVGDLAERQSENERVPSAKGPDRTPDPFATSGTTEPSEPSPTLGKPVPPPVPLVRFEDLIIDGEPVIVFGERSARGHGHDDHESPGAGTSSNDSSGHSRRFPLGTDLAALDRLGMRIAMGYEVRRLRRRGLTSAGLLVPDNHAVLETSLVVDVHNPEAIRRAEDASSVVRSVMKELENRGISRVFPGFDILTIVDGSADRLIELKSSGVDAQVQAMSWNEWKSAQANDIRPKFWLYLVGNLRADLGHARPFVRAVNDPFGTLVSQQFEDVRVSRAVQLRVREFTQAEQLELEVAMQRR